MPRRAQKIFNIGVKPEGLARVEFSVPVRISLPVKIIMPEKKRFSSGFLNRFSKTVLNFVLIFSLLISQISILSAFEAHVIGVTATLKSHIADHLVINKVYYNPDCQHGENLYNEWVEIYNPTRPAR